VEPEVRYELYTLPAALGNRGLSGPTFFETGAQGYAEGLLIAAHQGLERRP